MKIGELKINKDKSGKQPDFVGKIMTQNGYKRIVAWLGTYHKTGDYINIYINYDRKRKRKLVAIKELQGTNIYNVSVDNGRKILRLEGEKESDKIGIQRFKIYLEEKIK